MEAGIWEWLPDEILERVLTMLPLSRLLQMRSVSKEWSSLILSQGFINLCSQLNPGRVNSDFLIFTGTGSSGSVVAAFNRTSNRWRTLSFDHLVQAPGFDHTSVSVLASSGGLLCLATGGSQLAVCNPLTGSSNLLPAPPSCPNLMPQLTTMVIDRSAMSYKILMLAPGGCSDSRTFLYDSSTSEWSIKGGLPGGTVAFESDGIILGNHLYAIASLPYRLLAFDLHSGEWSKMEVPVPPGCLNPHLVLASGSLLLVTAYDGSWHEGCETAHPSDIFIWRLGTPSAGEWILVDRMPEEIQAGFLKTGGFDSLRCIGKGDSIYLSSFDGEHFCRVDVGPVSTSRGWSVLPVCEALVEKRWLVEGMFVVEAVLDIPLVDSTVRLKRD